MGFTASVKQSCLVQSARHCCVCHRYRGVKVEVHHIVPKEQGGLDTEDNAICLCFDCHADAGHYHAKHPKGTKFSPEELRKQKTSWYKIVQTNKIPLQTVDVRNEVAIKHLSCKSWEVINEILDKNFSKFPFSRPILLQNSTLDFLQKIIMDDKSVENLSVTAAEVFNSFDEIKKKYPKGTCINPDDPGDWAMFQMIRDVGREDLPKIPHGVIRRLALNGTSYNQLGKVLYGYGECGDGAWYENFNFRTLEVVFLHLENTSANNIVISEYIGYLNDSGSYSLIKFNDSLKNKVDSKKLPNATLKPGESILICEAIVLNPTNLNYTEPVSSEYLDLEGPAYTQTTSRYLETNRNVHEHDLIGSFSIIEGVSVLLDGVKHEVPIHKYDFNNYYAIDRNWNCGSCPHLFVRHKNKDVWRYIGEAISTPYETSTKKISISYELEFIQIAEIEKEISYLDYIQLTDAEGNQYFRSENIVLSEGQIFEIRVSVPKKSYPITIHIQGRYEPVAKTIFNLNTRLLRNEIVSSHLRRLC